MTEVIRYYTLEECQLHIDRFRLWDAIIRRNLDGWFVVYDMK